MISPHKAIANLACVCAAVHMVHARMIGQGQQEVLEESASRVQKSAENESAGAKEDREEPAVGDEQFAAQLAASVEVMKMMKESAMYSSPAEEAEYLALIAQMQAGLYGQLGQKVGGAFTHVLRDEIALASFQRAIEAVNLASKCQEVLEKLNTGGNKEGGNTNSEGGQDGAKSGEETEELTEDQRKQLQTKIDGFVAELRDVVAEGAEGGEKKDRVFETSKVDPAVVREACAQLHAKQLASIKMVFQQSERGLETVQQWALENDNLHKSNNNLQYLDAMGSVYENILETERIERKLKELEEMEKLKELEKREEREKLDEPKNLKRQKTQENQ
jgi:hypothetical protein